VGWFRLARYIVYVINIHVQTTLIARAAKHTYHFVNLHPSTAVEE